MAQPVLAEVRVSCPTCGGAIHPIAGRCKHCKADLVTARGGATAALGAEIQLGALGAPPPATTGAAPPLVTPRQGALPATAPVAAPPVVIGAAPVAARRGRDWKRQWPLLVAGVAGVAILISVAVLVFGGDDSKKPHRRRPLGPAPDKMETDQLPTDPWAGRGSGAPTDPSQLQPVPQAPPPDLNPGDPDDPDQPNLGNQVAPPSGAAPSSTAANEFLARALVTACTRLTTCWGGPAASQMCDQLTSMATQSLSTPDACPRFDAQAADRCIQKLAQIPCPDEDASLQDLTGMASGFDDCLHACQ